MSAQILPLPTRPEADLTSLVVDVAHARRVSLADTAVLDVAAVVEDALRERDTTPALALAERPGLVEQAIEEALAALRGGVLAPLTLADEA